MKRIFLSLAFMAISLPLSLEAKPTNQLLEVSPLKEQPQDTESSFEIGRDAKVWSLEAGLVRLRPKGYQVTAPMTRGSRPQEPKQVMGLVLNHKF
ncbi:MAG: hypothetical protein AAB845_00075 [Patescibacteria group bacterium]